MMKKSPVPLSQVNFERFGTCVDISRLDPTDATASASGLFDYWKQLAIFAKELNPEVGFFRVHRRTKRFGQMERHLSTPELLVFLNDDVLLPVAPASARIDSRGRPGTEGLQIIDIPRYAAVLLPAGAWHTAGFPVSQPFADAYVVFQDNTSANDIEIVDLSEEIVID
jgi:hypothetical protein